MSDIEALVRKFEFTRILASDPQTKSIVFLGTIDGKDAIVSLEKTAFTEDEENLKQLETISQINGNDIYYWGMTVLKLSIESRPSSKLNLIYPATEKHIKKYNTQRTHIVAETPEMYKSIVKPYIETMKGDRIQWVKNILYNNYEADKIAYQDEKLVLLPDMKWDGTTLESLYLVCIVKRDDISSVRDLNESHIEYLTELASNLRYHTAQNYDIEQDELRLFVHYHPSYYHFHVHVVNVKHPGLGFGIAAGKLILLEDVIDNLRFLGPQGYKAKTMTYVLGESHDLWELFNAGKK